MNWKIAVSSVAYNNCFSISDQYSYKSSEVKSLTDNVLGLLIGYIKPRLSSCDF